MTKKWTMTAYSVAIALVLFACGDGISNATPRDVVESMHKLSLAGNLESMAKLVEPSQQQAMLAIAATTREFLAATEAFRALVEERLGPEEAELVGGANANSSPFAEAAREDGSLDWSKIEIVEEGDKAVINISGKAYRDQLVNVAGKWYVSTGNGRSPEEMMKEADKAREGANKMMAVMKELEEGINAGEVTKGNFKQKYLTAALKAMMSK